jgi:hypothetical protein
MPRLWTKYNGDGIGWFRVFGIGLHWKNITKHPLLFGERYGYRKGIMINNWRIGFLKYDKNT